jgi:predicted CoA-binding protein
MNNISRTTLVLGASLKPERYSHLAILALKQSNIPVLAIGLRSGDVNGIQIHTEWDELPQQNIDTVTLYLGESSQQAHYRQILEAKPRRIIFNPGAENPALMELAEKAGIETLEACTLVMLRTGQF